MKIHQQIALLCVLAFIHPSHGAQQFRRDINPALRYYQSYLEVPKLADEDHDYLFKPEWRGQTLDQKFGELIQQYDLQCRFLREAAHAQAPCDWGIDLTEGPDALL